MENTEKTSNSAINPDTVRHVAKLARLELDESEVERYTNDLAKILELVEQLNGLDLNRVDLELDAKQETVYRPNGAVLALDREQVFKNAPHEEDHCFRVPQILSAPTTPPPAQNTEVTHA